MARPARIAALLAALALLSAACSDSAQSTTTVPRRSTTTAASPPTSGPATTTTTTTTAITTIMPATSTTVAPATSTTTTTGGTATTTTMPAATDADGIVTAKTGAVLAAVPEGWTGTIVEDTGTGDDIIFSPCLDEDDFDLDNLDAFSTAVSEVDVEGPEGSAAFGPASATVEARVFASEAIAADAFAVLQKVLGTDEGRQCLAATVSDAIASDTGGQATFAIEPIDVAGAGVAVRFTFGVAGFSLVIDLAATLIGSCTVYAAFVGVGEPFPPDVAQVLFSAAAA